jgi:hypothetical protein
MDKEDLVFDGKDADDSVRIAEKIARNSIINDIIAQQASMADFSKKDFSKEAKETEKHLKGLKTDKLHDINFFLDNVDEYADSILKDRIANGLLKDAIRTSIIESNGTIDSISENLEKNFSTNYGLRKAVVSNDEMEHAYAKVRKSLHQISSKNEKIKADHGDLGSGLSYHAHDNHNCRKEKSR